jgi:MFS transporter, DHA2 family, multidrug resistance protein
MRETVLLSKQGRPIEAGTVAVAGRLIATSGLMVATALQGADALIVNVALPQLGRDLGGGIELGTWVMTSYLCATAVTAPLTGWLRRRCGAPRLFHGAVWAFIVTSLLCGFAPSGGVLILLRVLQGAAGGIILPLVQAILLDLYPQERHARLLGILGAIFMLGPIFGPLLGGVVTDIASWRAVFLINLPLGLVVLASTRRLRCQEESGDSPAIDGLGVVLLMIAVGALQLSLERGVGRSWRHSPELLAEASAFAVALGVMAARARYSGFAVFRPAVFKDINFSVAAFYNFMTSGLMFVAIVFLPALGEGPLGYTATLAGFTIVPRAILLMLMMLVVGELMGKVDHRILLSGGWLLMAIGLAILSQIRPADGLLWMIVGSTVQSLGAGLLFTPHSTLAFATLAPELRTDAAGLFSLLRQLGYASGVALMTAVLRLEVISHRAALSDGSELPGSSPSPLFDQPGLLAYSDCFRMMAVAAVIVIPGIFLFRPAGAEADGQDGASIG